MSLSNIHIDTIKDKIDKLFLSEYSHMYEYKGPFYDHITSMMKYLLLNPSIKHSNIKLDEKNYRSISQYIFENSNMVEQTKGNAIDWNINDEAKDILRKKIKILLKNEGESEFLKPIVDFTVDSYENWLIYYQLHPTSMSNPWLPTNHILQKGYLYIASDKKDLIENYKKNIYDEVDDEIRGNIGIITKNSRERSQLSGFLVDNRHNVQTIVFEYLKNEAKGIENAKGSKDILKHLLSKKIKLNEQNIRERILIPLKRSGLIGSYTQGFFYINSISDLVQSYRSHLDKKLAIQRTLDLYIQKAEKMGVDNLDERASRESSDFSDLSLD
jgi:hypothetical protein